MPKRRTRRGGSLVASRYGRSGMGQGGEGFMDFPKNAFNFGKRVNNTLKNTKVISRGADVLTDILPGRAGEIARTVGNAAGSMGYGRRR